MRAFVPRCGALRPRTSQISRSLFQRSWQPASARYYSIKPEAASVSKPQDIDPSKLTIEKAKTPGPLRKPEELIFGATFTGERPIMRTRIGHFLCYSI